MKQHSVIDLHCDLLGSIDWSKGELDFETEKTICSIPQLERGKVALQVLAVAGVSGYDAVVSGKNQVKIYQDMLEKYPTRVGKFSDFKDGSEKVHCMFAIENASTLAQEKQPLSAAFERLEKYHEVERILYVSLTWNHENRFGGGNQSNVGLKDDGKALLELMCEKQIAIDFSHTSDALAHDLFNYIDQKGLDIPIVASHSNLRVVKNVPRNLPDEFVKEIFKRGGIIGLNFVKRFVGKGPEDVFAHIEKAFELGGEKSLCLGADFYGEIDIPEELCPGRITPPFFAELPNSGCYSDFAKMLEKRFSEDQIESIFNKNARQFLQNIVKKCSRSAHSKTCIKIFSVNYPG